MKAVAWTRAATDDLREAKFALSQYHDDLARDLVVRAIEAAQFLLDYPGLGTPMVGRWRKWRIPRTRYLLIYRPSRTGIEIGRVRYDRSNWKLIPE